MYSQFFIFKQRATSFTVEVNTTKKLRSRYIKSNTYQYTNETNNQLKPLHGINFVSKSDIVENV